MSIQTNDHCTLIFQHANIICKTQTCHPDIYNHIDENGSGWSAVNILCIPAVGHRSPSDQDWMVQLLIKLSILNYKIKMKVVIFLDHQDRTTPMSLIAVNTGKTDGSKSIFYENI